MKLKHLFTHRLEDNGKHYIALTADDGVTVLARMPARRPPKWPKCCLSVSQERRDLQKIEAYLDTCDEATRYAVRQTEDAIEAREQAAREEEARIAEEKARKEQSCPVCGAELWLVQYRPAQSTWQGYRTGPTGCLACSRYPCEHFAHLGNGHKAAGVIIPQWAGYSDWQKILSRYHAQARKALAKACIVQEQEIDCGPDKPTARKIMVQFPPAWKAQEIMQDLARRRRTMTPVLLRRYDNYCEACRTVGTVPLGQQAWRANMKRRGLL